MQKAEQRALAGAVRARHEPLLPRVDSPIEISEHAARAEPDARLLDLDERQRPLLVRWPPTPHRGALGAARSGSRPLDRCAGRRAARRAPLVAAGLGGLRRAHDDPAALEAQDAVD